MSLTVKEMEGLISDIENMRPTDKRALNLLALAREWLKVKKEFLSRPRS